MKKKIAIMILTSLVTLSLVSCGSEEFVNTSTSDVVSVVQSVEDAIESASQESESTVGETEEEPESESEESESQTEEQESPETPEEEVTESQAEIEESAESSEETPAEPEAPTYTFSDKTGVMYAKSSVNVRDLPSTDGSKVSSLSTNDKVDFTGICNETGWYRFSLNGKDVYVSGKYLTSEKVAVVPPVNSNPGDTNQSNTNQNATNQNDGTAAPTEGDAQASAGNSYGTMNGTTEDGMLTEYIAADGTITLVNASGKVVQVIKPEQIGNGDGVPIDDWGLEGAEPVDEELDKQWQEVVGQNQP